MTASASSPIHKSQPMAKPVAAKPAASSVSVQRAGGDHDGDGDDRAKAGAKVNAARVAAPRPGQRVNGAVYL